MLKAKRKLMAATVYVYCVRCVVPYLSLKTTVDARQNLFHQDKKIELFLCLPLAFNVFTTSSITISDAVEETLTNDTKSM